MLLDIIICVTSNYCVQYFSERSVLPGQRNCVKYQPVKMLFVLNEQFGIELNSDPHHTSYVGMPYLTCLLATSQLCFHLIMWWSLVLFAHVTQVHPTINQPTHICEMYSINNFKILEWVGHVYAAFLYLGRKRDNVYFSFLVNYLKLFLVFSLYFVSLDAFLVLVKCLWHLTL